MALFYLAIDPGNDTGWALFRSYTEIVACGLGDPRLAPWADATPRQVGPVIIEKPVIYPNRNMKGDPNDILKLAIGVGEYKEFFQRRGSRVALVEPRSWKGSIPKDVHHARVWGELSPSAQAVVSEFAKDVAPSKRHNLLDAVALGRGSFRFNLWLHPPRQAQS